MTFREGGSVRTEEISCSGKSEQYRVHAFEEMREGIWSPEEGEGVPLGVSHKTHNATCITELIPILNEEQTENFTHYPSTRRSSRM